MASTVAQEGVDEELENQGRSQPAWSGLQNIESLNGGIVQMKTHEKQDISTPTANLYLF